MGTICYSVQRQFERGIEYRNPKWFTAPLYRAGDRVVVCGQWPDIVAAYQSRGVPVTAQAGPYFGEVPTPAAESGNVAPFSPAPVPAPAAAPVTAPDNPLFAMTRAELQVEAKARGVDLRPGLSRAEMLKALGAT